MALEALQRSKARYRALVEASTRMVWSTDPQGMVEDMPYWRELTGQTIEQVRGSGWLDALHPADRARVATAWWEAHEARATYEADYRLRHADGTYRWYRARGAPVLAADGSILEWVGVFNDVDDERRHQAARRLLERTSEALVSATRVREALAAVAGLAVEMPEDGDAFADACAVDVPRPGGGFERVAVASRDPARAPLVAELERFYPTRQDAPAGYPHVIRTGQPELRTAVPREVIASVAVDDRHFELLTALDMYSVIVVPLRARGETLGAVTLVLMGEERRRTYDAHDLAVAEELARRAGLALDNAMRHEAEQAAALRAQRLLAVTSGLGRAQTPEEVADVIYREGLVAMGADAGALALMHDGPNGPEFETVLTHGYRTELIAAYRRYPLRAGRPMSDAVLSGVPVLIADRAEWERRYPAVIHETGDIGYEAFVAVPIMAGGRPIAGFGASFRERVTLDEATRTFLATLGEQCGLALERARAFAAVRHAEQASAFLAEASALLAESLDYEATLQAVTDAAVPRLGDWCTVDLVDDPTADRWPPRLARIAVTHRDPATLAFGNEMERRYPSDRSELDPRAVVLRERRSLFAPVVTDEMLAASARDDEHLRMLRTLGFSSVIMVPLLGRGLALGVLTLCHAGSGRRYDAADLALAEDLAHRVAVAIDNARLFRDAERAREEAEAANRAKSQFLSTMSHELRTPLNAIAGYVDLLDMELRGPITGQQRDDLSRIRRSSKVLMSLVNDVLNFARLEAGQVEVHLRDVVLADVLAGLETLVTPQVRAKALSYAWSADRTVVAHADPDRVEQVLTNLLTNAIKFTPEGGEVRVSVGRGAGAAGAAQVWVKVADTGRGIAADQLEQIFEPFVQVDRHLTRESQQGVGLGLAISRDLARLMGGELTVESERGKGSVFTLTLPAA